MQTSSAGYSAIVLGATGNVGGQIVRLLIDNPRCSRIVLVTRRPVNVFAGPKVSEIVVNLDRMEEELPPFVSNIDIALAAFGVGKGSARMPDEEVRRIEVAYPGAFCRAAKAAGARVCGMMTAAGANPKSSIKYARIIGEKEQAAEAAGFDFLGLFRPGTILGNSNTPSALGFVIPVVDLVLPAQYRSIHKDDLAQAMVAQSEQAFLALAAGKAPAGAPVKRLNLNEMKPFYRQRKIVGGHDMPPIPG